MGDKIGIFNNIDNVTCEEYLIMSSKLNELLNSFYQYLEKKMDVFSKESINFVWEIIDILNLKNEIKTIEIISTNNYTSFYNYDKKHLRIDFGKLVELYKNKILDQNVLLLEFFTILFHELCNLLADEREASIESAKLIYKFINQNNINDINEGLSNIKHYLFNGYANIAGKQISPFSTILEQSKIKEKINIENIPINKKIIYGIDVSEKIDIMQLRVSENKDCIKKILKI